MKKVILLFILAPLFFLSLAKAQTQNGGWIILDDITVEGHKRTREAVVFRELPFRIGDTIPLEILADKIIEAERQLMNTGLFSQTSITYKNWEGATQRVHLLIEVLENWYLYPVPTFDLADRNFNVWWKEQNRSLQRVNIGLEVNHTNFSGWGDELEIGFEYGYTRSFNASYNLPYINKKQTLGIGTNFKYDRNREVNYATLNNKQEFYRDDDKFLRRKLQADANLTWRPKLYARHTFALEYHHEQVDPIIIQEFNPDYFGDSNTDLRFFRLLYIFDYDFRDNRAYPWSGYVYGGELNKDGIGFFDDRSALTLQLYAAKYWPVGKRWSFGLSGGGKYSFIREQQASRYNRALGFGRNRVTGFELYVLDGLDAAYLRKNIRFRLWEGDITFGKWVFLEAFRQLPFHLNLTVSNDLGYVNSPFNDRPNPLNNTLLWGGGVGLDFVFYYDFVLGLRYNGNHLGDRGFFLDFEIGI
ncbi:MAG: BamA/TamA family outer membrane protein [Bacteroidota bacterium]